MKTLLLYIALLSILTQCGQKQSGKNFIVKNYYNNGEIKDSLTFNAGTLKDGKCFYYDDHGNLDSIVTFLNGKRNGLKSKYFGEYGIHTYNYKNDSLIEERNYDTLNNLTYVAPLNVKKLPKTYFRLLSNRTFLTQKNTDTIELINLDLPPFNRGITILGATFRDLKKANTYEIRATADSKFTKSIDILIKIFEKYNEQQIPTRIDTLRISLK